MVHALGFLGTYWGCDHAIRVLLAILFAFGIVFFVDLRPLVAEWFPLWPFVVWPQVLMGLAISLSPYSVVASLFQASFQGV
jgi:hypothetical protein